MKKLVKNTFLRANGIDDSYIIITDNISVSFILQIDRPNLKLDDNYTFIKEIYPTEKEDNPIVGKIINKYHPEYCVSLVNAVILDINFNNNIIVDELSKFKMAKAVVENYFI